MSVFRSIALKETLQIVRDTRTVVITIAIPVVLLLLFGFAISTEVNNVRIVTFTDHHTNVTRSLFERMRADEYFTLVGQTDSSGIEEALRKGSADAGLIIRSLSGNPEYQIIVDSSNPTMAQAATSYLQTLIDPGSGSTVTVRTLYNPQMKSAYNFVPGILGMIFILICAIMTSVSIVREKETGTMDLLLISPVNPRTVIFGKLVPYFVLSCLLLALMLAISYTLLGLPFSDSVVSVICVSLLYIILSLSIGLLVSTIVETQIVALMVSAVVFMLPVILLSGMIFPIENMPKIIQWISAAIPARWFVSAMRKLMVQELPITYILTEIKVLGLMTIVILALAIRKFNRNR